LKLHGGLLAQGYLSRTGSELLNPGWSVISNIEIPNYLLGLFTERYIVAVETIEQRSTARKHAPRYKVLLHNDDFNTMEHVVQSLVKTVASLTIPQAVSIMMEAHTNGLALVITCAQEHAEFYCEGLKTQGLTSTIEPDE
jgi:ATP-dependent Clp protease adaptor protein ClpS